MPFWKVLELWEVGPSLGVRFKGDMILGHVLAHALCFLALHYALLALTDKTLWREPQEAIPPSRLFCWAFSQHKRAAIFSVAQTLCVCFQPFGEAEKK